MEHWSGRKRLSQVSQKGEKTMSNAGIVAIKIVVAAGGAALGILIARWSDELLTTRLQEKSNFDKGRYAQGLGPQEPVQNVSEIPNLQED
jgi:hypothetical protein